MIFDLIIKTFAVSQLIYLAQTIALGEGSHRAANRIIYKYLWNKHYDGNRAPERIKRSIMLTPVDWGGFGLIDLKELCDSLHLRSYGRLINSNHPFLMQLRPFINSENFFNVRIDAPVDNKMLRSIELLNRDRQSMLSWNPGNLLNDAGLTNVLTNSKLKSLLNRQGTQSLNYFVIHQRGPNRNIGQLTLREFDSVSRFIVHRELVLIIRELINRGQQVAPRAQAAKELYPLKREQRLVNISGMSSKLFRQNNQVQEDQIICLYKLGLALTPGEVLHWTKLIKSLSSTRHKNILLRTAHGDIFSNERLCRFGLVDDPRCANCDNQVETRSHRLIECEKAQRAWAYLDNLKQQIGLTPLQFINLECVLGTIGHPNKLILTLNAELLHRLAALGGKSYCPIEITKSAFRTITACESLKPDHERRMKEILNGW